ncbi:MAG TPA: metallophosphoesterase [Chthoniobacteraceae bacterium]|nr:metallophosphoesterase [Chthoniobacteraceae bacterium]
MSWWQKLFWALCALDAVVWLVTWLTLRGRRGGWRWASLAAHLFFATMLGGIIVYMYGREHDWRISAMMPAFLTASLYLWHLVVLPLALAGFAIAGAWKFLTMIVRRVRRPREAATLVGMTRREFFGRLLALAPPSLTAALTLVGEVQLHGFRIRRITVPLAELPPELDGMTIANVADIHTGRFTHGAMLGRIADPTNELNADLVLFAGDLINDSLSWLDEGIARLKKIRGPLFACEGNHDLFANPAEFRRRVKASGLKLLVNESATLRIRGVPVQILGLPWASDPKELSHNGTTRLALMTRELLQQRDSAAFPILLAHHPHAWDYASGIPLTISGHTHGGQLMLSDDIGFGPEIFRYWSGLYTQRVGQPAQGEALVVSNGTGNWFPLRVNAPAEIVHITLKRATT